MDDHRPPVFHSNPNKDFLRGTCDFEIIKQWCSSAGHPLKYLGLPAWEMSDIICWEAFLGTFTTIEREENQQHLMFLRANVRDVEHRLHALYGEFDEILINGRDAYGHIPDWPFDIINLDYFGGFLYSNFSRPKAIRKLVANQSNYEHSFLLIITQHTRERDTVKAKDALLEDLRRSLHELSSEAKVRSSIDRAFDWYSAASTADGARQALYMNAFLRDVGESEQFDVRCRPAILYVGTGHSAMIHFVTEFHKRKSIAHKARSKQTIIELVNLKVLQLDEGTLKPLAGQPKIIV